jgi:fibronectin type III domain protein
MVVFFRSQRIILNQLFSLFVGISVLAPGIHAKAASAAISVGWRANAEPDLAGYRVYYGTRSGVYSNYTSYVTVGREALTARLEGLLPGTKYYLTMTAFNSAGIESLPTRELTNTIPTITSIPGQLLAEDAASGSINFIISDTETAASQLRVSARSSNPRVVPSEYVLLGGTGNQRSLMIVPQLDQSGQSEITVDVRDAQGAVTSMRFSVDVEALNDTPVVFPIADQVVRENTTIVNVPVYVFDAESHPNDLFVVAATVNPLLIDYDSITVTGEGNVRTLSFAPRTGATGPGVMQVYVMDPEGDYSMTEFTVQLQGVNDPPTISPIANMILDEDTPGPIVPVNVSDIDNSPGELVLTASSSNPMLVASNGIAFGGVPGNRNVMITPRPNQFGACYVWLTVTDPGGASASNRFLVTVNPINDPPNINEIFSFNVDEGSPPLTLPLSGINSGALNEQQPLVVTAESSQPGIIPAPQVNYVSPNDSGSLLIAPLPNVSGSAVIKVTVSDGQATNSATSREFTVSVQGFNNPPVILSLPNLAVLRVPTPLRIDFTIQDPDTPADRLVVTGYSSDTALLPDNNLVFTGSGTQRTLTVNPVLGRTGVATVTIVVSDGSSAVSASFYVLVTVAGT